MANFVERMMILHPDGVIDQQHLEERHTMDTNPSCTEALSMSTLSGQLNLRQFIAQTEIAIIKDALTQHNGNTSKAARQLSIGRTTLIEKIRKYKIENPRKAKKMTEDEEVVV